MSYLKKILSAICLLAVCVPMLSLATVQADTAGEGRKLEIITDMVHNNPGQAVYDSAYNDPAFLTQRGLTGKVFFLYDAAQYGIDWQDYNPDIMPVGSKEYEWVQTKKASLKKKYKAAQDAGQKIFFMMDMIVFPNNIKTIYGNDILTNGAIDISKSKTKELIREMFRQMFEEYPEINGIYIRTGETYVGSGYGTEPDNSAPYYFGNNPVNGDTEKHLQLIDLLKENVCETGRDVIYRTWGFDDFQKTREGYLAVADQVTPHEHLYFAIKHTSGDFWRNRIFNQAINAGQHKQIVEIQCAREYEGKGAFPNYVGKGVIDGFEEYDWQMTADQAQGLRDVVNAKDSVVEGVWTWSRGGGWNGPYINGKEVPEGKELWPDLNAYVIQTWAQDTSADDSDLVKQYAKEVLGMTGDDIESFNQLCQMSSLAVLLGIGTNASPTLDVMWTRDQTVNASNFQSNVNRAYNNKQGTTYPKLEEKRESVRLWKEMLALAQSLDDSVELKDYIVTTTKYGLYFFSLEERMMTAGLLSLETQNGIKNNYPEIKQVFEDYDRLWSEWQKLKEDNPSCPTLYEKSGFDNAVSGYRYELNVPVYQTAEVGDLFLLNATVAPYSKESLVYESSNPSVATVDAAGTVTAVGNGTARITTATKDGILRAATMVYVGAEDPSIVVLNEDFETYQAGESISWEKATSNTTDTVTFTAARDEGTNGTMTGKYHQPSSIGGGNVAYNYMFKKAFAPQTGIIIVEADIMTSAKNATYFNLYDSMGKMIAQVDFRENGKICVNTGTITQIYDEPYNVGEWYHVKLTCDTDSKTYKISVNFDTEKAFNFREDAVDVGAVQIGINRNYGNTVYYDNIKVYKYVDMDITAKDVADTILSAPKVSHTDDFLPLPSVPAGYEAVIKSSTDPQTVALDGRVSNASQEAKTVGLVFEVIRLSDGSKATTREIPVVIPSSTHWLTLPAAYAVGIGKTVKLIPDVAPYAATELVYSSSDPEIAAVDEQGVVTGAAKGVTMITVSTKDGKLRTATMIYAGEETVAYNEDFEGYENGEKLDWEQNIEEDRSTLTVIEKNRNRFLKLYQPVIGGSTSCYHMQSFAPQSGIVTTSFDMMAENKNYAYFLLCDSNGKIIVQVDFLSDYIYVDNGGKVEKISDVPYQAGQWYHITVTSNTDTAQYTISVEGQESHTFSFREAAVDVGMIKLGMFRDNENTVYYDNIHVTANQKSEIAVTEVARAVTSVPPVRNTDTTLPLPAVPDGFQIVIKSSDSDSVASDGTLYLGEERQTAGIIFTVIKTSDQSEAQTKKITVSIPAVNETQVVVPGDLNGDGSVNVQDVMEACKVLARRTAGKAPTKEEMERGDLDGDNAFTISDVMEICKLLARKA